MKYIMYEYDAEDESEGEPQLVFDIGFVPLIYGNLANAVRFAKNRALRHKKTILIYEGKDKESSFEFFLQINPSDYEIEHV